MFSGHEHIYQHNVLHMKDADSEHDLHIVVTSGGGVPLRYLPDEKMFDSQMQYFSDNGYDVESVSMERCFHYCRVTVQPTELVIETIRVNAQNPEDQTLMETITIDSKW